MLALTVLLVMNAYGTALAQRSPSWVDRLVRHGFEAVHWSTMFAATAT
jgi:hypothetical protein